MTADVEALKDALVTTCSTLTKAAQAAALSAMATAGVVSKNDFAQLAPGVPYPTRNLIDAGSLASQAQQTMQAVYSCADALGKLQNAFPPSTGAAP
jgi:hypothetical protein